VDKKGVLQLTSWAVETKVLGQQGCPALQCSEFQVGGSAIAKTKCWKLKHCWQWVIFWDPRPTWHTSVNWPVTR